VSDCRVVGHWRGETGEDATEDSKEMEGDNEEGKWKHFGLGEMAYMLKY